MKKIVGIFLSVFLFLGLVACNQQGSSATFKPGTYRASETGYNESQPIEVAVEVSEEKIEEIKVEDEETEGIGKEAIQKLIDQVLEKQGTDLDMVSGATLSSTAFLKAVETALDEATLDGEKNVAEVEEKDEDKVTEYETDVVIVGAGGAGLSAAIEAKVQGKDVLILEKTELTGGNTVRSTGGMNAAKTEYQDKNEFTQADKESVLKTVEEAKKDYPELNELAEQVEKQLAEYEKDPKGYFDSEELFVLDTLVGGQNKNDRDFVEGYIKNSASTIEWLKTLGMDITDVSRLGGASVNRLHRPTEQGKSVAIGSYLIPKFTDLVEEKGIQILFETPATELILEDDQVVGVKAGDVTVKAKSVILTSGGFGANEDKVVELRPELEGYVTTNAESITGDGIEMAEKIGAKLVDMDQIQIHPTVEQKTSSLITEGVRGDGAILVNQEGKRFINEVETRDVVSAAEIKQTDGYAYLIFDEAMAENSGPIQKYINNGFTKSAETYQDLAENLKIDSKAFVQTMETWNANVEKQKDDEFGRSAFADKLEKAPFYAIKVSPGVHYTMGGIKTNKDTQVLDKSGKPIKNLYAAGEVTGGLHGANRLGGNAVGEIIVYGRIAGQKAAENAN